MNKLLRVGFICFITAAYIVFCSSAVAQQKDSSLIKTVIAKVPESFKFSGYVDAYYAYYTDSVGTNKNQKFGAVSPKSNQFGINIVQLTAQYSADRVRAIATLHYGDLPSAAWSPVYNMIQEANAGVRLTKKIWLDAGFFKTHIGTEGLLPKDNITSSVSIITFYEPWWQSGFKLTYTPNDKFLICLHVLNGYNTYVEANKSKSIGVSLAYTFSERGSIGYYNLTGDDSPDNSAAKHMRFLNNLVFNYQLTAKLKTTIGVDYISQQRTSISDSSKTASVYSAIVTFKYQLKQKYGVYARGEMYSDKDGVLSPRIINTDNKATGYVVNGATLGFEYKPADNAYIRLEGRDLIMDNKEKIFRTDGSNTNSRIEAMIHIGIWFQ